MNSDLTAIVPYRADESGARRRNLEIVIKWLIGDGLNVVLVEHSTAPDPDLELPASVKRIHIQADDQPFNKALACNVGFVAADSPMIALVDADTLVPTQSLMQSIHAVRNDLDAVRPFGRLVELDEDSTNAISDGAPLPSSQVGVRDDARQGEYIPLCGGIVIIRSSAYERVGGMDETFQGWGGEDDALSVALARKGMRCGILEHEAAFHLAHPRSVESRYGHANYAMNLERARWWHEASDADIEAYMIRESARLRAAR